VSVLVLIEGQVRPESIEELRAFMEEALPEARMYEGCLSVEVYANQIDRSNWVWVERWVSRQHYERYMARRAEVGAVDQVAAMFRAPLSIRFFDEVEGLNEAT
jgi:quinol monooxygenase YgiN